MHDALGSRMKGYYESRYQTHLPRRTNVIIRIDGKAFHTYTKNLVRPFDTVLIADMIETCKKLCKEIQGCKVGYVQSDEISLLLTDYTKLTTDVWFDGNVQKIVSVSASMATVFFNQLRKNNTACFDSRVFTIPEKEEVANYFVWRTQDAVRNSVQSLAQSVFSAKQLNKKNISQLHEMLYTKGINWNDLQTSQKQGTVLTYEDDCWEAKYYLRTYHDWFTLIDSKTNKEE